MLRSVRGLVLLGVSEVVKTFRGQPGCSASATPSTVDRKWVFRGRSNLMTAAQFSAQELRLTSCEDVTVRSRHAHPLARARLSTSLYSVLITPVVADELLRSHFDCAFELCVLRHSVQQLRVIKICGHLIRVKIERLSHNVACIRCTSLLAMYNKAKVH